MAASIDERESVPIWSEEHDWTGILLSEARDDYERLDSQGGLLRVENSLEDIGDSIALGVDQVGQFALFDRQVDKLAEVLDALIIDFFVEKDHLTKTSLTSMFFLWVEKR